MLAIYTSANYQYLDRVLTLVRSVKRHYPDVHFCLLLSERSESQELSAVIADAGVDEVLPIRRLSEAFADHWIFGHNVIELCTAVKGAGASYLFSRGYEKVIYLDPDTVVFRRLDEVETALDTFSCVLTPHICAPTIRKELKVIEQACFRHGVFNLGFGAWRNDEVGRGIVDWWHANLVANCYEEPWNALYTDQKFFDLVPAIFDQVMILRNPAYNVATWNLESRSIEEGPDVLDIRVDGTPLAFFHFAGSGGRGQGNFHKWFAHSYPQIERLWDWYGSACAEWGIVKPEWSYGTYDDGRTIEYEDRVQYRRLHENVKRKIGNPFASAWRSRRAMTRRGKGAGIARSNEVAALRAEIELLRNSVPVRLSAQLRKFLPDSVVRAIRRTMNAE